MFDRKWLYDVPNFWAIMIFDHYELEASRYYISTVWIYNDRYKRENMLTLLPIKWKIKSGCRSFLISWYQLVHCFPYVWREKLFLLIITIVPVICVNLAIKINIMCSWFCLRHSIGCSLLILHPMFDYRSI